MRSRTNAWQSASAASLRRPCDWPQSPENNRGRGRSVGQATRLLVTCCCLWVAGWSTSKAGAAPEEANTVAAAGTDATLGFENEIVPILTRFGCNTSGCHGKAEGQNGFKLSVFGFDPVGDYQALTQEGRGRRIQTVIPEQSLLLTKAAGLVPHGGGVRIDRQGEFYRTLRDWIAAGLPWGDPQAPKAVAIRVEPREESLHSGQVRPLKVVATLSDGSERDVTRLSRFQSNNEALATVDEAGVVKVGDLPGDVAIMASYMGLVDVFRALLPRAESAEFPELPAANVIDRLVHAKLRKLQIVPSGPAEPADLLRRVSLDLTGTLPTPDEVRDYLADERPDRYARLLETLLQRPEFVDFWTQKWGDILRVDRQALGHRQAYEYHRFLRQQVAANTPLDRFCRSIVAARGPLAEQPGGSFFKVVTAPGSMASTLSQVFLGVRIECAQCHHHPYDRWGQDDYLGMQALFTGVSFKSTEAGDSLQTQAAGPVVHPRTGAVIPPHPLGGEPVAEGRERREALAEWMTAPDNPWFARNLANRLWAHLLGRGLVEPVDDQRLTNPPTNPELLDALAEHLVQSGFDARALIRLICLSETYRRSSTPNETNQRDGQNYSRFLWKRPSAEVLFDAVCQVTGVEEKFAGVPAGVRAIELWDSQVAHDFLKLFGRPTRLTACECERTVEPSVGQVLHVLNSPAIEQKVSHAGGRIARLTREISDDARLIDELFLTFLGRHPQSGELEAAREHLRTAGPTGRQRATEDLAWSLLNTLEFQFIH